MRRSSPHNQPGAGKALVESDHVVRDPEGLDLKVGDLGVDDDDDGGEGVEGGGGHRGVGFPLASNVKALSNLAVPTQSHGYLQASSRVYLRIHIGLNQTLFRTIACRWTCGISRLCAYRPV
jgi:hypothetical protein